MSQHTDDPKSRSKFLVYIQGKTEKTEERTLVFTNHSIHVQSVPGHGKAVKTEAIIPFIDITSIKSTEKEKLVLVTSDKTHHFTTRTTTAIDDVLIMIKHVVLSLEYSFPAVSVEGQLVSFDIKPEERLQKVRNYIEHARRNSSVSLCGGFRTTHDYYRLYFNTAKQEDVVWDVETVYVAQNTKTMVIRDFDHLDPRDWLPIIASMAYNPYFTGLDLSQLKLSLDAQAQVLHVMKHNRGLDTLLLDGCGLKSDFCHRLGQVVTKENRIMRLDLGNNPGLGDTGASHLCGMLTKLNRSLTSLRLAGCGLSARSVNYIADALLAATSAGEAKLQRLDLSQNLLKGEDLQSFYNYLAKPNSLLHLNLGHCDLVIDSLSASLTRGCVQNLVVLDLSYNNQFTSSSNISATWSKVFAHSLSLREIILSHCRLPARALDGLLSGLADNTSLTAITLDISANDLRGSGADTIAKHAKSIDCVNSLDISENDFGYDLIKIFSALSENLKLQHLTIGQNFSGMKSKQIIEVLEQLCNLISIESSNLESLSLADAKLKTDITIVINELANNTSLRRLDISGNAMGDQGARPLARVLCINDHLEELSIDRNGLSLRALEELATSLAHNYTIRSFQIPVVDLAPHMARNGERASALLTSVDKHIQKNLGPKKFSAEKAFNLAQGFQRNSSQQWLDQLVVTVEKYCSRLEGTVSGASVTPADPASSSAVMEMVREARRVLADARSSRNLLVKLQSSVLSTTTSGGGGETLQRKLGVFAKDLQSEIDRQLKTILESIITVSRDECPTICSKESLAEETRKAGAPLLRLPRDFVKKLLDRSLESEIASKVDEVSLNLASSTSDIVLDSLISQLDESLQRLTKTWNSLVRAQKRAESQRATLLSVDRPSSLLSNDGSINNGDVSPVSMRKTVIHAEKTQRESLMAACRRRPRSSMFTPADEDGSTGGHGDSEVSVGNVTIEEAKEEEIESPSTLTEQLKTESPTSPSKRSLGHKLSKLEMKLPISLKTTLFHKKSSSAEKKLTTSTTAASKNDPAPEKGELTLELELPATNSPQLVHHTRSRPRRSKVNTPSRGLQVSAATGEDAAAMVASGKTGGAGTEEEPLVQRSVTVSREQTPDSGVGEEVSARDRALDSATSSVEPRPSLPSSSPPPISPPPQLAESSAGKPSRPRSGLFMNSGMMAELVQRQQGGNGGVGSAGNKKSPATTPLAAKERSISETTAAPVKRSEAAAQVPASSGKLKLTSSAENLLSVSRSASGDEDCASSSTVSGIAAGKKSNSLNRKFNLARETSAAGNHPSTTVPSAVDKPEFIGYGRTDRSMSSDQALQRPSKSIVAAKVTPAASSGASPSDSDPSVVTGSAGGDRPMSVKDRAAFLSKQSSTPPPIPPNKPTRVPSNKPIASIGAKDGEAIDSDSDSDIEILV